MNFFRAIRESVKPFPQAENAEITTGTRTPPVVPPKPIAHQNAKPSEGGNPIHPPTINEPPEQSPPVFYISPVNVAEPSNIHAHQQPGEPRRSSPSSTDTVEDIRGSPKELTAKSTKPEDSSPSTESKESYRSRPDLMVGDR